MKLRDVLRRERWAENKRIQIARIDIWESEQPKPTIPGWNALFRSYWEGLIKRHLTIYV